MLSTERGALIVLACVLIILAVILASRSCQRAGAPEPATATVLSDSLPDSDTAASSKSSKKAKKSKSKKKSAEKNPVNSFQRSHRDESPQ